MQHKPISLVFFSTTDNEFGDDTLGKVISCIKRNFSRHDKGLAMLHHYVPQVPLNVVQRSSRRPSLRVRMRPMDSLNFTFQKLKDFVSARLRAGTSLSQTSGPNLQSALAGFMAERGYADSEVIGSILRASYRRNLEAHVATLRAEQRTPAYIANRKSLLGHWRRALIEADQATAAQTGSASPFQTALKELFSQGASRSGVCRATGLPLPTLKRWLVRRHDKLTP